MPKRKSEQSQDTEVETEKVDQGVGYTLQDGKLVLSIDEVMVWVKLSRGDYNRNQVYSHVAAKPAVPWTIAIPVGELMGLDALRVALSELQAVVSETVNAQVSEVDRQEKAEVKQSASKALGACSDTRYTHGVEVKTPIKTIESPIPRRSGMDAAAVEPPGADDEF